MPEFIDKTAAWLHARGRSRPLGRSGLAGLERGAILAIVLAWSGATAAAQSVCVVCEAPEQSYSCSYAPLEAGASAAGRGERALQMRCITELAKLYGHAQCKVNANSFGVCAGEVHMLREGAGTEAQATPGEAAAPQEPARPAAPEDGTAKAADEAPKTVVEMARRAAGATQEQIEQSGVTVEDAMRQTWRCVTSLFARCSQTDDRPGGEGQ